MEEQSHKKQSIGGFRVVSYMVKGKNGEEKLRVVLEADIESIAAANCDMGDIQKALLIHKSGETEVGFSLFVN